MPWNVMLQLKITAKWLRNSKFNFLNILTDPEEWLENKSMLYIYKLLMSKTVIYAKVQKLPPAPLL